MATGFSYMSITPGAVGDIVRATGEATWDTGLIGVKVTKKISQVFGHEGAISDTEIVNDAYDYDISSAATLTKGSIVVDEDIAKFVEEVEETVAEVDSILRKSSAVNNAAGVDENEVSKADRLAEEARLAEIEYLMEEAKLQKEVKLAEEEFLAEEEKLAELARLEEEASLADLVRLEEEERLAEEARLAEEGRLAEEARLAEEGRLAEEERIAEEARLAEEERIAEEARLAEEERLAEEANLVEEEDEIQVDDWEASIQLAKELTDEYADEMNEWNAARQLAEDLVPDKSEEEYDDIDFNDPGLSDEERMELIAKAARAAVEKFDKEREEEEKLEILEKERRNEMKLDLSKNGVNGLTTQIEVGHSNEPNYEKMTVVQLKEALRNKGLKVSGRKAELIERLQSD